ncbi:Uncharacterised protein [Klebsiella pneumoniae]|uniref:Uncharacterized protein n=1 Tax=Klebsiella pneumoniae TaxID=573 RepID=A0A378F6H9_KLEPN|nr:Uncharacterised protein [Klebsiella pneumoniae]
MSGIITLVIALILLVAAVYNLISYIRDRRSASLPSKKNQALKVIKAVFSLPRRDWPAHLFALLRAQKSPCRQTGAAIRSRTAMLPPHPPGAVRPG